MRDKDAVEFNQMLCDDLGLVGCLEVSKEQCKEYVAEAIKLCPMVSDKELYKNFRDPECMSAHLLRLSKKSEADLKLCQNDKGSI